jgi:hypothetical protein
MANPSAGDILTLSNVVYKDTNGRAQVVDPAAAQDIATRNHVRKYVKSRTSAIFYRSLSLKDKQLFLRKWFTIFSATEANAWVGVAWSAELGLYAAVSSTASVTSIMTSPDGIIWTARTTPSIGFGGIAWSPELGLFVATASNTTTSAYTSSDGITWTGQTTPSGTWAGITWSPELGLFAAINTTASTSSIMVSSNGTSWTAKTTPNTAWWGVVWSPELALFVATGNNTTSSVLTSSDGNTWTTRTTPGSCTGIAWSPELGLFAATGGTPGNMYYSSNGTTWTGVTMASTGAAPPSIVWSSELGYFLAYGSSGGSANCLSFSKDGKNWYFKVSPDGHTNNGPGAGYSNAISWNPDLGQFLYVEISGTQRVVRSLAMREF